MGSLAGARARPTGQSAQPGGRLVVCVWVPVFELCLERIRRPELAGRPLALPAPTGGTRRVVDQGCERARAAGVRPGALLSQAIALCPTLEILEPDPDLYDEAQEMLLARLREWTPLVEPTAERGRVFIGVGGLERLYGPPAEQIKSLTRHLSASFPSPLIARLRLGYAPGKFGAWVAARVARPGMPVRVTEEALPGFLAQQPVRALPVGERMIQRLERLRIGRLGQLAELPEPALVAQFGAEGRRAIAWATGRRIDPVRPEVRFRPIRVAIDFASPVGQLDLLWATLDRLLDRALASPARRGRSVRGVRLSATLEDGGSWSTRAILREPTGRKERIAFILRSRVDLAPPPRAVESLQLELFRFGPPSTQMGLFEPKRDAPRKLGGLETSEGALLPAVREAASQLALRLGEGALFRVLELQPESRIPERRHALLELST